MTDSTQLGPNSQRIAPTRTESVLKVRFVQYGRHRRLTNKLINKDNEWIIHFMGSFDRLLDSFEHLTANYRPTLNGERFFTDKEVSARLKVSRRTLQDYRNEGRIAYIQLGGEILYRESDIERMLADGYHAAYRLTGT